VLIAKLLHIKEEMIVKRQKDEALEGGDILKQWPALPWKEVKIPLSS